MRNKKLFSIYLIAVLFATVFLMFGKARSATPPSLKEGTYLTGQTLSVWPSWSLLGNSLGVSLPSDPINQLATAGTCANHTNIFCTQDSQCQAPVTTTSEKCVLHDPETGWSVTDRRFSFACSKGSYAYRYIVSPVPGAYTVRAHFEDPGIVPGNINNFVASFVSTSIIKINDSSGICNQDQEISTMQTGVCGDGKLNIGEQCDPAGGINYGPCGAAQPGKIAVQVCNSACKWVPSSTPYISCSALSKCGNSTLEFGETCDDGNLNGKYNHCNITCNGVSALGRCGDGALQSDYEICDPGTPGVEKYALNKNNSCSWDCQKLGPYCGDSITQVQYGEECDGSQACSVGGNPGIRVCTSGCKKVMSQTSSTDWACVASSTAAALSAPGTCGDAVVGGNEACDKGLANNGKACTPAYGHPCSYCSADCQNTIDVQPAEYCGDAFIESAEKCEVSQNVVYSASSTTGYTSPTKDLSHNGYAELACANETPAVPHTIKKGTKSCADCSKGTLRNCVQCGADVNGVSVGGGIVNVLYNAANSDPLYAKITNNSALSLTVGGGCPSAATCSNVVVEARKNAASPDLLSYALINPYPGINGLPPINTINSAPICSTDNNPNNKYAMYVNYDWTRPINFPVLAGADSGQYDLLLSPVVQSSVRPKDLRVVVSWVGSADFFSGFLNPFVTPSQIEGPSFVGYAATQSCQIGLSCQLISQQASGITYYNSPASFKHSGVWYHGYNSTPSRTNSESFTIDTGAMTGNTYAFYVRSPSYPIRTFKNTAKLKVDVYLPENDSNQYHFGTPIKTYYFTSATPSDNPNARYWQVFNINQPVANLSVADIVDINKIVTGPLDFIYQNSLVAHVCGNSDWTSSVSPVPCPVSGTQTITWTLTGNCAGGVTHPSTETVACTYVPPTPTCTNFDWSGVLFPATCPPSGSQTVTWTKLSNCTGGVFHPPSEVVACSYNPPTCTNADWSSSISPIPCPPSQVQTVTWTKVGNCSGGVTHPASETVTCVYTPAGCTASDWTFSDSPTPCPANGTQTRTWTKTGSCSGGVSHPATETITCTPASSCTDGIQNGTETGVDCGGSCPACVVNCTASNWTFSDSPTPCPISGTQTRTWTKIGTCTGGVSHPATESVTCSYTPTCSDGIKNGTETGVDCGGSCPACATALSVSCSASPTSLVPGGSTTWTATASGGTGSYTYNWSGTDGLSGTSQAVAKSYPSVGTKTASVTVVSGSQTITQPCSNNVTVAYPILAVSCSASPNPAVYNQFVMWTATASGGNGSYTYSSWSGTDGLSDFNTQSTGKTYNIIGAKTANVNITSGDGQSKSSTCNLQVNATVPSMPVNLNASSGYPDRHIALGWSPPASDGGSPVTGYYLYRMRTTANPPIFTLIQTFGPSTFSFNDFPPLGSSYYYKISAFNSVGQGPATPQTMQTP